MYIAPLVVGSRSLGLKVRLKEFFLTVCGVVEAAPEAFEKEPVLVAMEPVPILFETIEPFFHAFGSPSVC